jgi:hypothetical protein
MACMQGASVRPRTHLIRRVRACSLGQEARDCNSVIVKNSISDAVALRRRLHAKGLAECLEWILHMCEITTYRYGSGKQPANAQCVAGTTLQPGSPQSLCLTGDCPKTTFGVSQMMIQDIGTTNPEDSA